MKSTSSIDTYVIHPVFLHNKKPESVAGFEKYLHATAYCPLDYKPHICFLWTN